MELSILILSTADWDQAVWTNKQHLAMTLAPSHRVSYVESLGLRRPQLRMDDLKRIVRRGFRGVRNLTTSASPAGSQRVEVVSPLVVPFHRGPMRAWNRRALRRAVEGWLEQPQETRVLWTFTPITYGLHREAATTVYHCVDLLADFPGVDSETFRGAERRLAALGVPSVASSRPIAEQLERLGFEDVRVWENVAQTQRLLRPVGVERDERAAVFAGNLSPHKVDFDLIQHLLVSIPDLRLELAGPVAEGGGREPDLDRLVRDFRVTYHGVLGLDGLGDLMNRCVVGLVPYRLNDYTRGVFPMKIYEYLASGLAVVSTSLPSLTSSADVVLASDEDGFVRGVSDHLRQPTDKELHRRRAVASEHSWPQRGDQVVELIQQLLASAGTS